MRAERKHSIKSKLLMAALVGALVFTMMPLTMGAVFAEDTTVSGLAVTGDVVTELSYADMKTMKNDEAIKAITKKEVPFHGVNKSLNEFDVTVDGVTVEDLIGLAGLKTGAKLIDVTAVSTGSKPGEKAYWFDYVYEQDITATNKMMFAWNMVEGTDKSKVQTVFRGQMFEGDINKSDWYTDVTELKVRALDKPVASVKAGKKKATVKWAAVPNAENMVVLRATKKNGKYKTVKTLAGDKTSFTNKKLKKGKVYFFKVKAVVNQKDKDGNVIATLENLSAAKKVKVK